jgi:hypothetical protein
MVTAASAGLRHERQSPFSEERNQIPILEIHQGGFEKPAVVSIMGKK